MCMHALISCAGERCLECWLVTATVTCYRVHCMFDKLLMACSCVLDGKKSCLLANWSVMMIEDLGTGIAAEARSEAYLNSEG